jgi:hypothetical protein
MALYRERIYGLLVKPEATSGTDSVPTAGSNAVKTVGIPTITVDYLEQGTRNDVVNGVLINEDRAAAAGRFAKIEGIALEVKGSGTAGTPPEADALLRAAGFSVTTSAGVSNTYTTIDQNMETVTAYAYGGGKLFKVVGCVATFEESAEATKRGMFKFTLTGKLAADPTETALPALTLSNVIPPLFHSAAASIGSWTSASAEPLQLLSVDIKGNETIAALPSAGATDGLVGYLLSDRKTSQTMKVRTPALASFDPYALSKADGSTLPNTAHQIGTAAGNRLKVTTGKWALVAPKLGAQDSVNTYDLDGTLGAGASGAATRELVLLFD